MDHRQARPFDTLVELLRLALPAPASLKGDRLSADQPRGDPDWPRLLDLAHRHGVLPLVQAALPALAEPPPSVTVQGLRQATLGETMRSLALQSEAVRLTGLLDEAGIPFLILKGLALQDAYGSIALRPFVDNDVLVHPAAFKALEALLVREGGYVREQRRAWQKRGYLFVHGQYTFGRFVGEAMHTLDVHTSVMPFGYRYSEDFESLRERSRAAAVKAAKIPVLSWEDQIVVLCVNGLKDRWNRLRLVADLVAVASKVTDWDRVVQIARRASSLSSVLLGMTLAEDLLRYPAPPRLGRASPQILGLARELSVRLRADDPARPMTEWERVRLYLLGQDNAAARARYVAYTLVRRATEPFLKGTGQASFEL